MLLWQDYQRGDPPDAFAGEGGSNASFIRTAFRPYVESVVMPLVNDSRVLWWEVYNEPCEWHHFEAGICTYFEVFTSTLIKEQAYKWTKALQPSAPVISCWAERNNTFTDVLNVHMYDSDFVGWSSEVFAECPADSRNASAEQCLRGAVVTEAGARWFEGTLAGELTSSFFFFFVVVVFVFFSLSSSSSSSPSLSRLPRLLPQPSPGRLRFCPSHLE